MFDSGQIFHRSDPSSVHHSDPAFFSNNRLGPFRSISFLEKRVLRLPQYIFRENGSNDIVEFHLRFPLPFRVKTHTYEIALLFQSSSGARILQAIIPEFLENNTAVNNENLFIEI